MTDHARLKRREPTLPEVTLGEAPERVRFTLGERYPVPAHKELDLALEVSASRRRREDATTR